MSSSAFRQFLQLLPQRPLEIGKVVAVDGSSCIVELPGGGRIRARGNAQLNDSVFVRDGQIEGPAPSYTPVILEV